MHIDLDAQIKLSREQERQLENARRPELPPGFPSELPCGVITVRDIDGNTYNTVRIGTQCWMRENLRVTRYNDGTNIPLDTSGGRFGYVGGQTWSSRTTGARTVFGHDRNKLATRGYLYNWYAAKGIHTTGSTTYKNICPTGWHVPTDAEWTTLINFLGGDSAAGGKMKSTGTTYWSAPNRGATNESGFTALPGGNRSEGGDFTRFINNAFFLSATGNDSYGAWVRSLNSINSNVYRGNYHMQLGASVRCIRD